MVKKSLGVVESKIKLDYDDNPNYAGEAVRQIRINDVVWNKERKHHGRKQRPSSCLLHLKLFREERHLREEQ